MAVPLPKGLDYGQRSTSAYFFIKYNFASQLEERIQHKPVPKETPNCEAYFSNNSLKVRTHFQIKNVNQISVHVQYKLRRPIQW